MYFLSLCYKFTFVQAFMYGFFVHRVRIEGY